MTIKKRGAPVRCTESGKQLVARCHKVFGPNVTAYQVRIMLRLTSVSLGRFYTFWRGQPVQPLLKAKIEARLNALTDRKLPKDFLSGAIDAAVQHLQRERGVRITNKDFLRECVIARQGYCRD